MWLLFVFWVSRLLSVCVSWVLVFICWDDVDVDCYLVMVVMCCLVGLVGCVWCDGCGFVVD